MIYVIFDTEFSLQVADRVFAVTRQALDGQHVLPKRFWSIHKDILELHGYVPIGEIEDPEFETYEEEEL
jgi:hypothetical protein